MAGISLGKRIGVVAILAVASTLAAPPVSAGQTELLVLVTPYVTQPTKQNQAQNTEPGSKQIVRNQQLMRNGLSGGNGTAIEKSAK